MGYVKPTSAEDIDPVTIEAIARLLGLSVPPLETTTLAALGTGSASLRSVPGGTRPDRCPASTRLRPAVGVVMCVS
jgi:hypothetical protein